MRLMKLLPNIKDDIWLMISSPAWLVESGRRRRRIFMRLVLLLVLLLPPPSQKGHSWYCFCIQQWNQVGEEGGGGRRTAGCDFIGDSKNDFMQSIWLYQTAISVETVIASSKYETRKYWCSWEWNLLQRNHDKKTLVSSCLVIDSETMSENA